MKRWQAGTPAVPRKGSSLTQGVTKGYRLALRTSESSRHRHSAPSLTVISFASCLRVSWRDHATRRNSVAPAPLAVVTSA